MQGADGGHAPAGQPNIPGSRPTSHGWGSRVDDLILPGRQNPFQASALPSRRACWLPWRSVSVPSPWVLPTQPHLPRVGHPNSDCTVPPRKHPCTARANAFPTRDSLALPLLHSGGTPSAALGPPPHLHRLHPSRETLPPDLQNVSHPRVRFDSSCDAFCWVWTVRRVIVGRRRSFSSPLFPHLRNPTSRPFDRRRSQPKTSPRSKQSRRPDPATEAQIDAV